jgi:hypothetical protein
VTGKELKVLEGVFTKCAGRKDTREEQVFRRSNRNVPNLSKNVPKK